MIRSAYQELTKSDGKGERRVAYAMILLLRILGCAYLALSLWVWGRTIGYWPGEAFRFDTMNVPSRIYYSLLCVIFPITAVGLWSTLSWGRVVWVIAVFVQVGAYMFFQDPIDVSITFLNFHGLAISLYLSLEIGLRLVANDP